MKHKFVIEIEMYEDYDFEPEPKTEEELNELIESSVLSEIAALISNNGYVINSVEIL